MRALGSTRVVWTEGAVWGTGLRGARGVTARGLIVAGRPGWREVCVIDFPVDGEGELQIGDCKMAIAN